MARLLAWLSLAAYATATSHGGNGGWGGGSKGGLPFVVPPSGNKNHKIEHVDINQYAGGHQGNTIIIIWTNNGGGEKNQVWNEAPVEKGQVHQVTVGGDAGLVYSPEELHAAPGDMIEFTFLSQNHTVTQSTFADPCTKMAGGFDSGFMANPNNTVSPPPKAMFQVTSQEPVWMYCRQGPHCSRGMVFSVNPTAEKSHIKFKETALKTGGGNGGAPPPPPPSPPALNAPPATPPAPEHSIVPGHGQKGDGGECSCSCLCGASAYPPGAGIGGWGGWGGSMPMPGASKRRRSVQF